jgi:predicted amidohydrolase YtcJ
VRIMLRRILNCRILVPSGRIQKRDIFVSKGKISAFQKPSIVHGSPKNTQFDAKGRIVLPGFIDCHCHLFSLAETFEEVNLVGTRSISEMQERILTFSKLERAGHDWLFGRGWDQDRLKEGRFPSRKDLDKAIPQKKLIMTRVCGHIAVMNTRAIEFFRVKGCFMGSTDDLVPKEPAGAPTGIVKESVLTRCWSLVPNRSNMDLKRLFLRSQKQALKFGLVGVHCILDDLNQLRAIKSLDRAAKIKLKLSLFVPIETISAIEEMNPKERESLFRGGMYRVLGFKLFADGSLGARTAALSSDYSDDPGNSGVLNYSDKEIMNYVTRAKKLGLILATHAIGDRAVDQTLRAYERVGIVKKDGFRIEHCSIIRPDLIGRLSRVILCVQPSFAASDYWLFKRIGRNKSKRFGYGFKTLKTATRIAGSSDAPVESIDPLRGIASAILNDADRTESLPAKEAFRLYTEWAAELSPLTRNCGSIECGKNCDLIVLDTSSIDKMTETRVESVFIDGVKVFSTA